MEYFIECLFETPIPLKIQLFILFCYSDAFCSIEPEVIVLFLLLASFWIVYLALLDFQNGVLSPQEVVCVARHRIFRVLLANQIRVISSYFYKWPSFVRCSKIESGRRRILFRQIIHLNWFCSFSSEENNPSWFLMLIDEFIGASEGFQLDLWRGGKWRTLSKSIWKSAPLYFSCNRCFTRVGILETMKKLEGLC